MRLEHPRLQEIRAQNPEKLFHVYGIVDHLIRLSGNSSGYWFDFEADHNISDFGYKVTLAYRKHMAIRHFFMFIFNFPTRGLEAWKDFTDEQLNFQGFFDEVLDNWADWSEVPEEELAKKIKKEYKAYRKSLRKIKKPRKTSEA